MKAVSADGVEHEFPDDTDPKVVDFAMKKYALNTFGGAPESGPHFDQFFTNNPAGRILDAFGQGAKSQWGFQGGETWLSEGIKKPLQDLGLYNDVAKGQNSPIKSFNEAMIRPMATALQSLYQGVPALIGGAAGAVRQVGKEVGLPEVGEAIAAIPEVLPGLIGVPMHLPEIVRQAQRERIIGDSAEASGGLPPLYSPLEAKPKEPMLPFAKEEIRPSLTPPRAPQAEAVPPTPEELARQGELPLSEPGTPPVVERVREVGRRRDSLIEAPAEVSTPRIPTNHLDAEGRIRLDSLESVEDVNRAIEQKVPRVSEEVPPLAMINDLADAAGVNVEDISNLVPGPPERVQAKIDLLTDSARAIHDAAAKVAEGADLNALMDFIKAKDRHWTIQDAVLGEKTPKLGEEIGTFKTGEAPGGAPVEPAVVAAQEQRIAQIEQQQQAQARATTTMTNPKQVSQFTKNSTKAGFWDMFYEWMVNSWLSGLATHSTYAVGNVGLLLAHVAETGVAGLLGKLHGGPKVLLGEAPASVYGFIRGQGDGVMASWEAAKSGVTVKLPGENKAPFLFPQTKSIPGVVGQIVRLPTHMTAGIHSYARAVGYSQMTAELAYRGAAERFTPGTSAFQGEFDRLYSNPTLDNMKTAADFSTRTALMGGSGPVVNAVTNLVSQVPALKFLIPFARMSGNAVRQGILERTPLGLALSREVQANIMGRNGAIARDQQIARLAVGTAVGTSIYGLAMQGLVTGAAPLDPKEAALWRETGHQPYSIKIGNTWHSTARIGSLALLVGAFADAHDVAHSISDEDMTKTAGHLMSSISHSLIDETWLRGPSDLIKAMTDWKAHGQNYINNQLASLVPFSSGLRQAVPAVDPYMREARTLLDTVKSRVPWWSESLLPKYSIWGQPIPSREALGGAGVTAIYTTQVNNDPVNLELQRLGIFPAAVPRHLGNVELTADQHADLAKFSGRAAKQRLDILVNSPGFSSIPDFAKRSIMSGIIDGARGQAEALVKMQNPSILRAALEEQRAQLGGALPKKNIQQKP